MSRRASQWFSRVASLVAFLGIGGCFFVGKSALGGPPRTLAPVSTHKVRIVVGPNVHASQANEAVPHEECVAAADPTNPARLLIAAMVASPKWGKAKVAGQLLQTRGVVGYYSEDGGETWQRAFEYQGNAQNDFSDPALAFGPDGSAYFVCLRAYLKAWEQRARVPIPHGGDPDSGCSLLPSLTVMSRLRQR
jgi:hypothetical protein